MYSEVWSLQGLGLEVEEESYVCKVTSEGTRGLIKFKHYLVVFCMHRISIQ